MTTTPPPGPTRTPGGFGIDPRLGAAALRVPAASREDFRPQAILKLHRPVAWITEPATDPRYSTRIFDSPYRTRLCT